MSYLEVPGAKLYYEKFGSGPLFLCISGGNGDLDPWRPLANALQTHFTVVIYDRRGFSRSALSFSEAQDYAHRVETDADDAALLIQHLTTDPTIVIGNSSGAIVALELLVRHPELIHTLLPHEPPLMKLLPDFHALAAAQQEIYDVYRASGTGPAFMRFMQLTMMDRPPPNAKPTQSGGPSLERMMDPQSNPFRSGNSQYWFERELLVYPFRDYGNGGVFEDVKGKLVFANGEDSPTEALQYRPNVVLGERLGLKVEIFPGGHMGFASHGERFAAKMREVLKARGVES